MDDARLFRELERSFLRRAGCEVWVATSGLETLEKARTHRPDVVVLEADLPGMDGLQCCRAMKADVDLGEIPVVFVAEPGDTDACIDAGADRVVERPARRADLVGAIREVVPLREREHERMPVTLRVDFRVGGYRERGRTKDIGRGGLFVRTEAPVEHGARIEMGIALTDDPFWTARASGEVVRRVDPDVDSHLVPGIGVRFGPMPAETQQALVRYLGTRGGDGP